MMPPRAVIYARCSTEEESQQNALVKQVQEAEECVRQHGWILSDRYIESKSGTSTKGRLEYNRLLSDMQIDKFDIIVIKSQDRLMRNTKDWYLFVDALCTYQKKLYMYIEGKYYTPDDSLITGIKAILAEDYSRELSKKINNAHKNRQKNSGNPIITGKAYGFKRMPDKTIVLVEEEASVKRKMYELCAVGYGARSIATILQNEGIKGREGKFFNAATILRMIKNPINKGQAVLNKRHFDFVSKQTIRMPEEEWFIHDNKVPPTVSEELWELANEQIRNRRDKRNAPDEETYGKNHGKYLLSGKIFCGICGAPYYRNGRKRYKDTSTVYEWKCKRYVEIGRNAGHNARPQIRKVEMKEVHGCDNIHLDEERFEELLEEIYRKNYQTDKESMIAEMVEVLKKVLQEKDLQKEIDFERKQLEKVKKQLEILVDKLLEGILSNEIYQRKQEQPQGKIDEHRKRMIQLEEENAKGSVLQNRIAEIEARLRSGKIVEQATVANMLEEVEKILIFPTYMEIHFSYSKMLGVGEDMFSESTEVMKVEYGNRFSYSKQKAEEREVIVDMMRENPKITANQLAEILNLSFSGVHYRINVLRKEGRIRFNGKGGKGEWEILD